MDNQKSETLQTTISNHLLTATITSKGAELQSLQSHTGREYIWDAQPEFWGKHSPVLFPIVGTLKNNCYTFNGSTYTLPRHGFARDYVFELLQQITNQVVFSLKANEETLKLYPFDFELQISYTLQENELRIGYTIINHSEMDMPFSIGGHPAFALTETFENYALTFEQAENLVSYPLQNDLISNEQVLIPMNGNHLPLTYSLFEKDALIFKTLNSKCISIVENNIPILHFRFDDFPNFGIWTKSQAPFICLEPWLGYSDTVGASGNLTEKEGIQTVAAKKTFACHFGIEIV